MIISIFDARNIYFQENFRENLTSARKELMNLTSTVADLFVPDQTFAFTGDSARLRWAILPCEAKDLLVSFLDRKVIRRRHPPLNPPFTPKTYPVRRANADENIGSLHGGECKVQNPTFLIPPPDLISKQSNFVKNPPKNVKPSTPSRKWGRPLSGIWSKEKSSKSKSIETLAAIDRNDDFDAPFNKSDDFDQTTGDWNKISMEEKMISYLMREYIRTNKERIFNHYN